MFKITVLWMAVSVMTVLAVVVGAGGPLDDWSIMAVVLGTILALGTPLIAAFDWLCERALKLGEPTPEHQRPF
ncbi:hypothetical protein [Ferrimonas marina]|uniref:Uncharacterized protein n=1 Tax=Ferrimonas marina TaxID=299255 RepID=A0A1M5N4T8_9GAMM|nr:hypothetical protein [Ferrimonas marina]SHG84467.1 hypothetical protein SAMN02745129_0893 [Ferrimonas marina]